MKKLIACLVLSLAAVTLFVGCAQQESSPPEAPDTNAAPAAPEAPGAPSTPEAP